MSPEKARVFVIEDDREDILSAVYALNLEGHRVVLIARDMREAIDGIKKIKRRHI